MSAWNLTGTGPPKPEIGSPGDAATGVQIVVQQLVGKDAVPVAGVWNSPIRAHVAGPKLVTSDGEVIDALGS